MLTGFRHWDGRGSAISHALLHYSEARQKRTYLILQPSTDWAWCSSSHGGGRAWRSASAYALLGTRCTDHGIQGACNGYSGFGWMFSFTFESPNHVYQDPGMPVKWASLETRVKMHEQHCPHCVS